MIQVAFDKADYPTLCDRIGLSAGRAYQLNDQDGGLMLRLLTQVSWILAEIMTSLAIRYRTYN